jgi:YVTN family beta-propeller protein
MTFGLLGPLRVVRAGQAVSLGGPRQRAVLAVLLLRAHRCVSVDELVDQVWNGRSPAGAVTSVQTYVFHLRRALEPDRKRGSGGDVLATCDRGYMLRVDPQLVDANRFESLAEAGHVALRAGRSEEAAELLRAALALWRDPVLSDLVDYEFVVPHAARLSESRLVAMEARIAADLALGRHATLVGELNTLITDHPLREHLHGLLMLALYRCGRQADALAAYQRVRELLAEQLGIDPGVELRNLHNAVLTQDTALDSPAIGVSAPKIPPVEGRRPRVRRLIAAGLSMALVGTIAVAAAAHPPHPQIVSLPANSVSALDGTGLPLGEPIFVGSQPAALVSGAGALWAINTGDDTVSRIDPRSRAVVQTIPVGVSPSAITVTGAAPSRASAP